MALSRYALHTSGKAKMGIQHCVFFCPICAYVTNNPTTFLDHIMVGHYWGSFSCGVCLAFATLTAAEMKAHLIGCGQYGIKRSKARFPREKAPQGSKSGRKSKGKKPKEGDGMKGKEVACKAVNSFKSSPRGQRRWLHSSLYCFLCVMRVLS